MTITCKHHLKYVQHHTGCTVEVITNGNHEMVFSCKGGTESSQISSKIYYICLKSYLLTGEMKSNP